MSDLFESLVLGFPSPPPNPAGREDGPSPPPATTADDAATPRSHANSASIGAPSRSSRSGSVSALLPQTPAARELQNSSAAASVSPPAETAVPSDAASARTASLLSDAAGLVESPQEELDEVDVLNRLIGGGIPGGLASARRARARTTGSWRSWGSSLDGTRSANPAREVEESLRSSSLVDAGGNAWSRASTIALVRRSRANTVDFEMGVDGDAMRDEEEGRNRREEMVMEGSLPENDGMSALRKKLHEVRTLAVSTEEKARRMHALMTQDYLAHKASLGVASSPLAESATPSLKLPADPKNPYNLCQGDLEPSFSPLPVLPSATNGEDDNDESMTDELPAVLGCAHYKRNVKVQCFDCKRWFPCRHCHDQSNDLPFEHKLNRKKTQNMLCMLCGTPQSAGEVCMNCGEYAAWYYCPKCKLWDNDSNKRIYHCDDCGICRVGEGLGKDYVHCRRCNVCITISTSSSHPCIERATEGDCPLCLVRLFESTTSVVSLPCGHYMHGDCYKDLMAVTYKCPVCSKSAVNMELQWRKLDDEIRAQPMPEDDEDLEGLLPQLDDGSHAADTTENAPRPRRPRTVYIGCNDCGRRSWTPFHWLGLKCQVCDSYNTNQMAPTAVQETEAERIMRQQQQHHRQHDFTGNAVMRDAGIGANDQVHINNAALQVPTSPSQLAINVDRRASGAQSPPGRRYFVQEEERRPSFTTPRFPTPNLPSLPAMPALPTLANLPNLPNLPDWPNLPNLPDWPNLPNLPDWSTLPNLPDWPEWPDMPRLPRMPRVPQLPNMSNMPNLELPRFSPYEMFDAVSRSLSPMRYYLAGLDVGEGGFRRRSSATKDRNRSPTSVRSDPTPSTSKGKRKLDEVRGKGDGEEGEEDDAVEFWGSDGHLVSSGDDESMQVVDRGDESSSEDSGSDDDEDEDMTDAEILDDDEEDGEEMELFGHR